MTTLVASPPRMTPTLLVPRRPSFSIRPSQPSRCNWAMASAAMAMALTPFSGATPAWLARPRTRIFMRYPPVAPMVTLSAAPPSKLKANCGRPSSPSRA